MKKLMTVLMVLALAGVANAALENFETYSTTSNFETAGAADWTFEPDPPDAEGNQKHLIVLDSANKVYSQKPFLLAFVNSSSIYNNGANPKNKR